MEDKKDGHVSILPISQAELEKWAKRKEKAKKTLKAEHPLTEKIMSAGLESINISTPK